MYSKSRDGSRGDKFFTTAITVCDSFIISIPHKHLFKVLIASQSESLKCGPNGGYTKNIISHNGATLPIFNSISRYLLDQISPAK